MKAAICPRCHALLGATAGSCIECQSTQTLPALEDEAAEPPSPAAVALADVATLPPHPSSPRTIQQAHNYRVKIVNQLPRTPRRSAGRVSPFLLFWLILLLLSGAVAGGLFGVALTLGKGVLGQVPPDRTAPTLQVAPSTIALGAMITVRGVHFSPHGNIGLLRDTSIPVLDTGLQHIVQADSQGRFTDTIVITANWRAGPHQITTEDLSLHKLAGSTIMVTGHGSSLRPAHLELSTTTLNLGLNDQAANSTQIIVLSNAGGGQINWQAASTQPWLLVSPASGSFSTDQTPEVMISGNRSTLAPGKYQGEILFRTDAGNGVLKVQMSVKPLQTSAGAVLQLSPAALSFTSRDGGLNPPAQVVTISNPGNRALQWSASFVTQQNWLTLSHLTDTLSPGASKPLSFVVNTFDLLPGSYSAILSFSGLNSAASPQRLYISVTVTPQCQLQVSPGDLSFSSAYAQARVGTQTLTLSQPSGCPTPIPWNVTSSVSWINVNATHGTTPASLTVAVLPGHLLPGAHSASLTFSSLAGTQTVPTNLVIAASNTPILTSSVASLNFRRITGQGSPPAQTMTISNSGGGTLHWNAATTTDVGNNWLAVTPSQGTLAPHASTRLTVSATLLASLTPATYTGLVTLQGSDAGGRGAAGSPLSLPVSFLVQAPCGLSTSTMTLTFAGVSNQGAPAPQTVSLTASSTCTHALNWQASATTSNGGSWLQVTPIHGSLAPMGATSLKIGPRSVSLAPLTYSGSISLTATDAITGRSVGGQTINVTFNEQPPCTLQTPSLTSSTFDTETGQGPQTRALTVGVTGACQGAVKLTATASSSASLNWLTVSPTPVSLQSGQSVTLHLTATSGSLVSNSYSGSLSLTAVNNGMTIIGSPQTINTTLNILTPAALSTDRSALVFNLSTGTASHILAISNNGGAPLNWSATLSPSAPNYVSLANAALSNMHGGANAPLTVNIDATGLPGGSTIQTSLIITASDAITGAPAAAGLNTLVIPITLNIAPPSMQINQSSLTLQASAGSNAVQTLTITNAGGNDLNWTTTSSQSWLQLDHSSGSLHASDSATLTITIDTTGMVSGSTYNAILTISPDNASPVDLPVTVMIA